MAAQLCGYTTNIDVCPWNGWMLWYVQYISVKPLENVHGKPQTIKHLYKAYNIKDSNENKPHK